MSKESQRIAPGFAPFGIKNARSSAAQDELVVRHRVSKQVANRFSARFLNNNVAFRNKPADAVSVAIVSRNGSEEAQSLLSRSPQHEMFKARVLSADDARTAFRLGKFDLDERLGAGHAGFPHRLRDFEAVYDSPDAAPHAVVRIEAKLVKMPERRIVAETSVSGRAKRSRV